MHAGMRQRLLRFALSALTAALMALAGTGSSKADLVEWSDTGQTEYKLFNDAAHKGVTSFTASIGKHGGTDYTATIDTSGTGTTVNTGAGFANIKPDTGNLTSLTITPTNSSWFSDFVFRGQLDPGAFTNSDKTATVTLAFRPEQQGVRLLLELGQEGRGFQGPRRHVLHKRTGDHLEPRHHGDWHRLQGDQAARVLSRL